MRNKPSTIHTGPQFRRKVLHDHTRLLIAVHKKNVYILAKFALQLWHNSSSKPCVSTSRAWELIKPMETWRCADAPTPPATRVARMVLNEDMVPWLVLVHARPPVVSTLSDLWWLLSLRKENLSAENGAVFLSDNSSIVTGASENRRVVLVSCVTHLKICSHDLYHF